MEFLDEGAMSGELGDLRKSWLTMTGGWEKLKVMGALRLFVRVNWFMNMFPHLAMWKHHHIYNFFIGNCTLLPHCWRS